MELWPRRIPSHASRTEERLFNACFMLLRLLRLLRWLLILHCMAGYVTQGNEFSYQMLFVSFFVLNCVEVVRPGWLARSMHHRRSPSRWTFKAPRSSASASNASDSLSSS